MEKSKSVLFYRIVCVLWGVREIESEILHIGEILMTENTSRTTIYLDPVLHQKLKIKAADTSRSVSALVNQAIRISLLEDAEDLAAFNERKEEPLIRHEDMVNRLKSHGRL